MEENKIQEAEVESVKSDDKEEKIEASIEYSTEYSKSPKRRIDLYIELALFLVLGFLIGVAVKTEAVKRITIGFDDYKMKIFRNSYDINKMQMEEAIKIAEEEKKQQESQNSGGAIEAPEIK